MTVSPTETNGSALFAQQSGASTIENRSALVKDDFLRLLVAQLRNQDPMNPADNQEFAAQLAQFSSLEQLQEMNSALGENLESNRQLSQIIQNQVATSYIGKDVRAVGNQIDLPEEGEATISFHQDFASQETSVKVFRSDGTWVRTLELGPRPAGGMDVPWDGKDANGNRLPAGTYFFSPEAYDYEGQQIPTVGFMFGSITGVRNVDGVSSLLMGNAEIPLSDVFDVIERR